MSSNIFHMLLLCVFRPLWLRNSSGLCTLPAPSRGERPSVRVTKAPFQGPENARTWGLGSARASTAVQLAVLPAPSDTQLRPTSDTRWERSCRPPLGIAEREKRTCWL